MKRGLRPTAIRPLALSLVALAPSLAWAQDDAAEAQVVDPGATAGGGDGVYGRFDGDLSYRFDLGLMWDVQVEKARPWAQLELNGYQTLGIFVGYGYGIQATDPVSHTLSAGATLSPLFLFRWSKAKQWGYPYLDLLVDSLTVSPGLVLATPREGRFGSALGFDLGCGLGVPLLPRADGPWLRSTFHLTTGRKQLGLAHDLAGSMMFMLEWQGFFFLGLLHTQKD